MLTSSKARLSGAKLQLQRKWLQGLWHRNVILFNYSFVPFYCTTQKCCSIWCHTSPERPKSHLGCARSNRPVGHSRLHHYHVTAALAGNLLPLDSPGELFTIQRSSLWPVFSLTRQELIQNRLAWPWGEGTIWRCFIVQLSDAGFIECEGAWG